MDNPCMGNNNILKDNILLMDSSQYMANNHIILTNLFTTASKPIT